MSIIRRSLACAAVLLAAGLAGSASAAPSGSIKLLASSEFRPALEKVIADFQKATNVTVDISYTDEGSINTVLPTQLSSGAGPDVFTSWPGTYAANSAVLLGQRGYAMDLSSESWAKDVPARFGNFVGFDNKIFYPPLGALAVVAMYNDSALDSLGLKKPSTWTEVLNFCKAATDKGVTAFAFGAQTDWQNQMLPLLLSVTLVDRVDPTFLSDRAAGKAKFATSPWVDVFAKEQTMLKAGCFGDKALGLSFEQAQTEVGAGHYLGMFAPASTFAGLTATNASAKFSVAAFPATDNADETWLPVALGGSYAVNANTQNAEAAKAFVDFLLQPENVAPYVAATGQAPVLPNKDFVPDDVTKLQIAMGDAGKTAPVCDQIFPNPKVRAVWISQNEAMLAGKVEPKDITQAMDDAWDGN